MIKVVSDSIEETKAISSIEKTECEVQDEYIEPNYFETQEWELECTVDVWKKLNCRRTPRSFKIDIIQRLKKLARGELLGSICEKIKLQTIDKSIEVFETGPILWEIAICFSQRLTESSSTLNNVLYTELIRIWDIFTDEKGKRESLEKITISCRKGEECLIEKYLTCSETLDCKYDKGRRIPRRFIRYSSQESKPNTTKEKLLLPASHFAKEYHVLKFYFFSTDMAVCALDPREYAKDFPFKVTEKEHVIINLSSAGPLLLMGRSGTGKTTCCLYRLWSQYDQHNKTVIEYEENQADEEDDSKQIASTAQMCEKDLENDVRNPVEYGHIRQIFISKNLVLCNEVRKTFYGIQNASSFESGRTTRVGIALPSRFQDLQNVHFPIFTTSRKLLLMIDASLPNPFFRRDEQGNVKADIPGWTNENESLEFLASIDDDSDIELDEIMNEEQNVDAENIEEVNRMSDVRREVTYEIFVNLVWPKINKGMDHYHPSLIWMEIISFIKGSFEALSAKQGHLSKSDYFEQGKKKAPNFTGERETVYEIFLRYRHYLKQHFMFDETDVVRHIFKRMNRVDRDLWNIQQIYVDETQDFTQAELYLLLNLCRNPNDIFLTGDTAQGIMRGICFRFEDLCSLFYHAKNSRKDFEKVLIPKKVHQLTHNYRSHNGILSLASSILDILAKYYPDSFDILEKDKGLFQGPAPILLESCSIQDVATMLATGKKQSTSNIEFGAHQAILVVNDESRDSLPEELQHGIVLTIYEAKGLEFDDILLYNFFKDSQAGKEWRVVTSFLDELLSEENEQISEDETESFVEIDYDGTFTPVY
ncbi:TPR and ankyrin repeat-containing protein 1-like [Saccostrea cucullata]|uniref:TPR and ankyrin repeat-containing protein 1-like n=1 Tax=Saccostrea cuccullata TaxID=36930 RepID=UPI002ED2F799